jgi:hypothetical protein
VRNEGLFILVALGIHAGVLLVGRAMPSLADAFVQARKPLETIDIIELPRVAPVCEVPEAVSPDAPRSPDAPSPEPSTAARNTQPSPGPGPQPSAGPEPNAPPNPDARPRTQFDDLPDERQGVLGLPGGLTGPGSPAWSMPGVLTGPGSAPRPAPTVAPAARPVDRDIAGKVIRDAMASRDKDIGLDLPVAGSMASAVRTAVQGNDLPAGTRGSIECRVSAGGKVSGCRVAGSNGGSPDAWASAVRAAHAISGGALNGQYAAGAVVTIDVSVSNTPPAGGNGGFKGAGVDFDISNIGAHATRLVRISHRVVAAR